MAKIKAPLFSIDASGTIDKTITYRNKPRNNTASKYAKPGDKNPFESSPRQKDQRSIIGLITACWQSKTSIDQLAWNNAAKDARFKGTGYHYFLHLAKTDLKTYLGLVGFWSMNYSNGDSVPDLSGNNNHGILSPIYPCDCPQPVNSFNKKHGKAFYYDNINDIISVPDSTSFNYISSELTFFALYKPYDIISSHGIAQKGFHIFDFYQDLTNLILWFKTSDKEAAIIAYNVFTHPNIWHLLCYTVNTITGFIYIYSDGKEINSSGGFTGVIDTGAGIPLTIGNRPTHNFPTFGIIDDVIIYNRGFSPREIQRHYNLLI